MSESANSKNISPSDFKVTASDGYVLRGVLYYPEGGAEKARAIVQLNMATASASSYYDAFCRYLSENGFVVALWDYRGMGKSAQGSLKDLKSGMADYGSKDMAAVLDFLSEKFPALPMVMVGHSVGGHLLGLIPNINRIKGHVAVASSSGYFGYLPKAFALYAYALFYALFPVSETLFGYMAIKRTGLMEDLPSGVIREWRAWCSKPDYFFDPKFYGKTFPIGLYQKFEFPIVVYWGDDDPISNRRSVPRFWANVKSSKGIDLRKVTRRELGAKKIGHFGYFRKQHRGTLWAKILSDLNDFIR